MKEETEDKVLLMLGEMKGQMSEISNNQDNFTKKLDGLDSRLRKQEVRAAGISVIISTGISLAVATAKKTFLV